MDDPETSRSSLSASVIGSCRRDLESTMTLDIERGVRSRTERDNDRSMTETPPPPAHAHQAASYRTRSALENDDVTEPAAAPNEVSKRR